MMCNRLLMSEWAQCVGERESVMVCVRDMMWGQR